VQIKFVLVAVAGLLTAMLAASSPSAASSGQAVNVLYAGSLVNLMEHGIGPAFDRSTGDRFEGYAGGSNELANQIKGKLREADVFISANPKVNAELMGPPNGSHVSWFISFAQSPLVIGYAPSSRFAADLATKPWYRVLMEPGIRIGRTDPRLDPKGALTLQLMSKAGMFYGIPGLARRVLGEPDNPAQVLPEETLIGRLQSGLIDVGFFYSTETHDAGIPEVALPASIAPKAVYTVTILRAAPHRSAGVRFVAFLLGSEGRKILKAHGLVLQRPMLSGPARALPRDLQSILGRTS
jgi:molybdate/tungstate transport system substrate-binding protein